MRTAMIFGVLILSIALCLQCALSAHYPDERIADSSVSKVFIVPFYIIKVAEIYINIKMPFLKEN